MKNAMSKSFSHKQSLFEQIKQADENHFVEFHEVISNDVNNLNPLEKWQNL